MTFDEWAQTAPDFRFWNTYDAAKAAFNAATKSEREECARTCELVPDGSWPPSGIREECAEAIRMRSNK